ncbi:MAG: hypothetical protein AB8U82_03975 [Rickettsia endosymbiont of Haemaphysalis japonica]
MPFQFKHSYSQTVSKRNGRELDVISTEKESTVFVCFLPITLPFIDNIINEIE